MRHRPLLQVRKLFRRGRCPHRPGKIPTVWRRGGYHPPRRIRTSSYSCLHQARFSRPAGHPSQDCPASGSGADAESIPCTARAGCAEPPQESAPRKWGPGLATGALALLGDKPRGSLVLSIPGKNTNRGRRPSPLPCWTPGLCYAVWLAMDRGPMRHRPLLQIRQPFVGADVPIRPL